MSEYKWYNLIEDPVSIEQGDIFESVPFYSPVSLLGNEIDVVEYQAVLMSQSCDLENCQLEHVIFCPIHTMDNYLSQIPNYINTSPEKKKK